MALGGSLIVFERPMLQGITSCLRTVGEGVSELLWPTRCVLCDVPGTLLCDECRLELPYIDPLLACPLCGQAHGKFACVDCNSFIVKHRGLVPDQRDSTRGEHDISHDVSRPVSREVSHSVPTDVSREVSHGVPDDVSRRAPQQALGTHKAACGYHAREEIPGQQRCVSQNESVSRPVHNAREKNVSRYEHHATSENVSRREPYIEEDVSQYRPHTRIGDRSQPEACTRMGDRSQTGACTRMEDASPRDPLGRKEDAPQAKRRSQTPLDQVASVFELVDPCRKLITTYKDHKEVRLASVLTELLVDYIDPAWVKPGETAIVVIPARHQAIRERGFDHMKLIGEKLAQLTGLPLVDAIEPNERGDQRGLSASSRQENMHDSFRPRTQNPNQRSCNARDLEQPCCSEGPSRGLHIMSHTVSRMSANIILVDDVLTTGATLTSAAITLKQMGARKVYGLTVARLP